MRGRAERPWSILLLLQPARHRVGLARRTCMCRCDAARLDHFYPRVSPHDISIVFVNSEINAQRNQSPLPAKMWTNVCKSAMPWKQDKDIAFTSWKRGRNIVIVRVPQLGTSNQRLFQRICVMDHVLHLNGLHEPVCLRSTPITSGQGALVGPNKELLFCGISKVPRSKTLLERKHWYKLFISGGAPLLVWSHAL